MSFLWWFWVCITPVCWKMVCPLVSNNWFFCPFKDQGLLTSWRGFILSWRNKRGSLMCCSKIVERLVSAAHIRTRACTLSLSLSHTHTHTHTHLKAWDGHNVVNPFLVFRLLAYVGVLQLVYKLDSPLCCILHVKINFHFFKKLVYMILLCSIARIYVSLHITIVKVFNLYMCMLYTFWIIASWYKASERSTFIGR